MIRRPPRSTLDRSSAASDVYKRQVEAVPLIAASIMSKKLAEGLTGLVLDIKRGSGSFITDEKSELALARAMIDLGARRNCPTVALFTAMDRPLGFACGNSLEVAESIAALKG